MADLEKVTQAQLTSALAGETQLSQRRLSDADGLALTLLVGQMQQRYPQQDTEESIEGILQDYEQLALKYSLRKVQNALAELRIKPGQKFFPRPDEVADEIEDQRERGVEHAHQADGNRWLADWRLHCAQIAREREEAGGVDKMLEQIHAKDSQ